MVKGIYVYCNRASASAMKLRAALREEGVRAWRIGNEFRLPRKRELPLINWGCTDLYEGNHWNYFSRIYNAPQVVDRAISKFDSLTILRENEIPCVRVTKDLEEVNKWISKGHSYFFRKDRLSSGAGMYYDNTKTKLEESTFGKGINKPDFFSRYFPKTHEFRAHVVSGKCIDFVQKKSIKEDAYRIIRTHGNGWVFAHEDIVLTIPEELEYVKLLAVDSCEALGLDFGAVDILCTVTNETPRRLKKAVVCEVNSAPGLENTATIKAYAAAFASSFLEGV